MDKVYVPVNTVFYQLQIPLNEDVSDFLTFWSSLVGKSEELNRNSPIVCPFDITI